MGIGGFTRSKLRSVGDEEKIIPSSVDTRRPMCSTRFAAKRILRPENNRLAKFRFFKFLIFDILNALRVRLVSAEVQLESQSKLMGSSGI